MNSYITRTSSTQLRRAHVAMGREGHGGVIQAKDWLMGMSNRIESSICTNGIEWTHTKAD